MVRSTSSTISDKQHWFVGGRSTIANLMSFSQCIIPALANRGQLDVIFTDFADAFNQLITVSTSSNIRGL